MPWWFAVAERDHEIQNPTSPEKILLLGERLRIGPETHMLDVACGKGAPAAILAATFGCRITGVERAPEFAAVARERVAATHLGHLVSIVEQDATDFVLEPEAYDVTMCLGASFVWEDLAGTLAVLVPATRPGGHVVVGEPYWRRWPLPEDVDDEGYATLAETASRFASAGLSLETLIDSSQDDWDRYETLHWRALEEWLAQQPDHPQAAEFRARHEQGREAYLRYQRELLGWAVFVGRKPRV
jgi:SAM-dependent methyltransferase